MYKTPNEKRQIEHACQFCKRSYTLDLDTLKTSIEGIEDIKEFICECGVIYELEKRGKKVLILPYYR